MSNQNASANTNAKPDGYYSPIMKSFGWPSKARFVDGHRGDPFWSVNIVCPRGAYDDYDTELIQTIVKGKQAIELIDKYFDEINDRNAKVAIVSNIGDLRPASFTDTDGNLRLVMKGSLLSIQYMKVNGEVVYQADPNGQEEDQPQDDPPPAKRQPAHSSQSRAQPARPKSSGSKPPARRGSQNNRGSRQASYAD